MAWGNSAPEAGGTGYSHKCGEERVSGKPWPRVASPQLLPKKEFPFCVSRCMSPPSPGSRHSVVRRSKEIVLVFPRPKHIVCLRILQLVWDFGVGMFSKTFRDMSKTLIGLEPSKFSVRILHLAS